MSNDGVQADICNSDTPLDVASKDSGVSNDGVQADICNNAHHPVRDYLDGVSNDGVQADICNTDDGNPTPQRESRVQRRRAGRHLQPEQERGHALLTLGCPTTACRPTSATSQAHGRGQRPHPGVQRRRAGRHLQQRHAAQARRQGQVSNDGVQADICNTSIAAATSSRSSCVSNDGVQADICNSLTVIWGDPCVMVSNDGVQADICNDRGVETIVSSDGVQADICNPSIWTSRNSADTVSNNGVQAAICNCEGLDERARA